MGINGEVTGGAVLSAALKRHVSDVNSPAISTPGSRRSTPPPPDRTRLEPRPTEPGRNARQGRHGASGFDADAVDYALRRELGRQQRETTPGASPHRKRQRINGDR